MDWRLSNERQEDQVPVKTFGAPLVRGA